MPVYGFESDFTHFCTRYGAAVCARVEHLYNSGQLAELMCFIASFLVGMLGHAHAWGSEVKRTVH